MKKCISLLILIILILASACFCMIGCDNENSKNGVYYIPEENLEMSYYSSVSYTAIVIEDKITIIENGYDIITLPPYIDENNNYINGLNSKFYFNRAKLYSLSKKYNKYYINKLNYDSNKYQIDFNKKEFFIYYNNKKVPFIKDNNYVFNNNVVKLDSLKNITTSICTTYYKDTYIKFKGDYLSSYGNIGILIEIKNTDGEYKYYNTIYYNNAENIDYNLFSSNDYFSQGYNYIRLSNIGGPAINENNEYFMQESSDYIEYKITLDNNYNITSIELI